MLSYLYQKGLHMKKLIHVPSQLLFILL